MIKKTVIAGSFYPGDSHLLNETLDYFFDIAEQNALQTIERKPLAIIVPHAGYIYSGQTAANIYQIISKYEYKKALIIAPLHRATAEDINFFIGNYTAYETPMGLLKTDQFAIKRLLSKRGCGFSKNIDNTEHSLEIQLPFLYYIHPEIEIIPILFCRQNLVNAALLCDYVRDIMTDETLLIVSTDLSHFYHASEAEAMDNMLIKNIKDNDINIFYDNIMNEKTQACGFGGILTLMNLVKSYPETIITDTYYTHSGNISKDYNSVVGYFGCVYRK